MTEHEMMQSAAYADVLADPGSDVPRERLADWLENRWPERARLIRVAVAHNRVLRRSLTTPTPAADLAGSGIDLQLAMKQEWAQPARSLGWVDESDLVRGCIGYVEMDASTFLERAADLFALFPVRHVRLKRCSPVMDAVCASAHLSRLRGLDIWHDELTDDDVCVLAKSPHIRNLRRLSLGNNEIGVAGFEALCASPNLSALQEIELYGNAAPDPVRGHNVTWDDCLYVEPDLPPIGQELERRYGYKPWLNAPAVIKTYPTMSEAFDGDDPV